MSRNRARMMVVVMKDQKMYWVGRVGERDDFGEAVGMVIYDGRTRGGPWALMTPASWEKHGIGRVGIGWGQKYEKQEDGRWLKTEG